MPRNASGTYSLPSGNPVSSGTLIDANWANNTLNDLANEVTDSLSRSAEGGMLAPLRLTDGVQATPSLAFTNEPSSGLYRAGTNDAWFVSGGNQVMQFTSSGVVGRLAAGAVGTPSLTFFGDLNTGLWSPAADTLAASTGGSERLRVDSSGNLGIGTASPSQRLEVIGQANATTLYATSNTASSFVTRLTNSDFQLYAVNGVAGNNSGDVKASIGLYFANTIANLSSGIEFPRGSAATNGWLNFLTSGVERMRLDASGNLGIGTASPAYRLDVSGAVQATDYRVAAASTLFLTGDSLTVRTTGAATRFTIDSNGSTTVGLGTLATTATDGFLYVPTCAGTPTGTPTAKTGFAPIVVNTTNNKLYFYSGGAWRDAGP